MSLLPAIPSHQTPQSLAETRQKIDEEITQLETRLLALKATRNKLSPIASLHNEVLQEIFVLSSHSCSGSTGPAFKVGKASLRLSWVCSTWRELAHKTSELWSYIDFVNPLWVAEAISRTRNRPLQFDFSFPSTYKDNPNPLAFIALGNLPRIHTLSIRTSSHDQVERLAPVGALWTIPAPLLVKLTLRGIFLPSDLFSGTFPSLQEILFDQCEFDWDSIPFHEGIRTVSITDPKVKVSAEDLLPKLRIIAPGLESLDLSNTLLDSYTNPRPSQSRFHFPQVNKFDITDDWTAPVTFLLNHLSLPSQCHELTINVHRGDISDQIALAHALVAARGLTKWPSFAIDIDPLDEILALRVAEDRPNSLQRQPAAGSDSYNYINVHFNMSHSSNLPFLMPIFSIFPLSPIERLTFSGGHFFDYGPDLMDYFNTQGAVTFIEVIAYFAPTFSGVLEWQTQRIRTITGITNPLHIHNVNLAEETKSQCRAVISFHSLKTLCYFAEGYQEFDLDESHLTILREWLAWRRVLGLDVEKLVFKEIVVPQGTDMRALYEGVVGELQCVEVDEKDEDE